jgi:hypothetical protein
MRHPHVLRASVCAAVLLVGGAAFAQGANYSTPKAGFTQVAVHGGGVGGGGFSGGGFHGGGFHGGGFHGGGGHWAHGYGGGWGGGPGYAYDWGYPDDYAYDYDDPDYAYDYGTPGAYCQTPETSCELDHPAVAGQPCQCHSGIDWEPGTAQP